MRARILVVDDEKNVRQTLHDLLIIEGYDVVAVESGEAALEALRTSQAGSRTPDDGFDLMLLDLKMPGIDGIETLRQASKIVPDLKVILLTGHGSMESAIASLRLGAQDYLLKPLQANEILSSVARGLAQRVEQQRKRLLLQQLETGIKQLKDVEGIETPPSVDQVVISLPEGVMADLARREIWRGNQRVSLTPTEGKLMRVFLENRGQVLTHQDLVFLVQGYETTDWEAPEVLRPLISRLRRKLGTFPGGDEWIANVRGTGYVFDWDLAEKGFDRMGDEEISDADTGGE